MPPVQCLHQVYLRYLERDLHNFLCQSSHIEVPDMHKSSIQPKVLVFAIILAQSNRYTTVSVCFCLRECFVGSQLLNALQWLTSTEQLICIAKANSIQILSHLLMRLSSYAKARVATQEQSRMNTMDYSLGSGYLSGSQCVFY